MTTDAEARITELESEISALRGDPNAGLPGWDVCSVGDHLWRWTREVDEERRLRVDVQLGNVVRAYLEELEHYGIIGLGRAITFALPGSPYAVREAQRLLEEKARGVGWLP